jgi:hypothetical protein
MRRTFGRNTITVLAGAGLAASTGALALGLGEIDVSSNLNQRLVATIPLTEISDEDLETVSVAIAPNDAFERAGLERSEYLSTLNFEVRNDEGRPRVVVTSSAIAREPVLNLLVQARWAGGVYAFWYPLKNTHEVERFCRRAGEASTKPVLDVRLDTGAKAEGQMRGSGLVIVNPPYRFADEMAPTLSGLARQLSLGPKAASIITWLKTE